MNDPHPSASAADLVALDAVVRALARSVVGSSQARMAELLNLLNVEAVRLSTTAAAGEAPASMVLERLNAWTETMVRDVRALGDPEAADASGRPIHFLD